MFGGESLMIISLIMIITYDGWSSKQKHPVTLSHIITINMLIIKYFNYVQHAIN